MNLAELGKELEKDKRAYNSSLLANYENYDFYIKSTRIIPPFRVEYELL